MRWTPRLRISDHGPAADLRPDEPDQPATTSSLVHSQYLMFTKGTDGGAPGCPWWWPTWQSWDPMGGTPMGPALGVWCAPPRSLIVVDDRRWRRRFVLFSSCSCRSRVVRCGEPHLWSLAQSQNAVEGEWRVGALLMGHGSSRDMIVIAARRAADRVIGCRRARAGGCPDWIATKFSSNSDKPRRAGHPSVMHRGRGATTAAGADAPTARGPGDAVAAPGALSPGRRRRRPC
eukprot:SAG31_NODE_2039_length_6594_cov_7.103926_3_plen_232_part_00